MRNKKNAYVTTHIIKLGRGWMRDLFHNWYVADIPISFIMVITVIKLVL